MINDFPFPPTPALIYRQHWLAFWKPLAFISLLSIVSIVGFLNWLPLVVISFVPAFVITLCVYFSWHWNSYTFTADNRLVYRHGFLGSTTNIISLFGVVTPYQLPIVGRLFDVGGIQLGVAGTLIQIPYIANFASFYNRLVQGAQRQHQVNQTPVQVIVQLPPIYGRRVNWPAHQYPEMLNEAPDMLGNADQENDPPNFGF